jgi:hypothetical protein
VATSCDEALGDRIGRLEADPAISFADVDLTIVHPDRLRRQFDEVFYYFALVEGEVAQNALDIAALLPALDDHDRRFLSVWSAHEVAHSAIFDALGGELGLPPAAPSVQSGAQWSFRAIGVLAQVDWLHDVLKLVYLARGAMHERLTLEAYTLLGAKLSCLGEHSLTRTVTDPIRRQEAGHLGYYRAAAAAHRARLSRTQRSLARRISTWTYAPVGAPGRRALCGRVFTEIADGDIEVLEPLEQIAADLLEDGREWDAGFVRGAMHRCLRART